MGIDARIDPVDSLSVYVLDKRAALLDNGKTTAEVEEVLELSSKADMWHIGVREIEIT